MGEFLVLLQICGFLFIRDIWCGDLSWDKKFKVIFLGVLPLLIYISLYVKPLTENDYRTRVDQYFSSLD
jgi:hypothetical protein